MALLWPSDIGGAQARGQSGDGIRRLVEQKGDQLLRREYVTHSHNRRTTMGASPVLDLTGTHDLQRARRKLRPAENYALSAVRTSGGADTLNRDGITYHRMEIPGW